MTKWCISGLQRRIRRKKFDFVSFLTNSGKLGYPFTLCTFMWRDRFRRVRDEFLEETARMREILREETEDPVAPEFHSRKGRAGNSR